MIVGRGGGGGSFAWHGPPSESCLAPNFESPPVLTYDCQPRTKDRGLALKNLGWRSASLTHFWLDDSLPPLTHAHTLTLNHSHTFTLTYSHFGQPSPEGSTRSLQSGPLLGRFPHSNLCRIRLVQVKEHSRPSSVLSLLLLFVLLPGAKPSLRDSNEWV